MCLALPSLIFAQLLTLRAAKNYPTVGKLIGLDHEEFVLELSGKAVKSLRCHFPRLNFAVKVSTSASKL